MNTPLFFHNLGSIISLLLALWLAPFVYLKSPKKTPNRMLAIALLMVAVFFASHLIGVNTSDPELSRNILMLNVSIMYLVAFNSHCVLALLGKAKEHKVFIDGVYILAAVLTVIYFAFPDTFLLPSEPKLYFPNYYVAGSLHWVMRLFFNIIIPIYFLFQIVREGIHADPITKNRLRYFFWSFISGYGIGTLMVPLVFDIPVNPAWGAPFVAFWAIPFAYAVIEYELLDITVVTKRAIWLTALVGGSTLGIFLISFSNNLLLAQMPGFPPLVIPLIASLVAVLVGFIVFERIKEAELLKYEFVNVVTHKFRTPLTKIKWETDMLINESGLNVAEREVVARIQKANSNLIELTSLLVNLTDPLEAHSLNKEASSHLPTLVDTVIESLKLQSSAKKLSFSVHTPKHVPEVSGNPERIMFVLHTLIENAIVYSPKGAIMVFILPEGDHVRVEVHDEGVGITKEEMGRLFEQFYRGARAKHEYTEGLGIGLHVAKKIVKAHGGKIWAESEGENKGTQVIFTLPVALK